MFKIFTENGEGVGNGHVSRCLLLYNDIVKRGYEPIIYLNKEGSGNLLSSVKYELKDWYDINILKGLVKDDYVIVDSYLANIDVLNFISSKAKRVAYFDDYDRVEYPKGLIICPTAFKKGEKYLCGEEFMLVRDGFYSLTKKHNKQQVNDIFLSLGTDVNNCLNKVLKIILESTQNAIIHVVNRETINHDRVKTYYNLDEFEMAKIMNACDFSIVSCGQTLLENLVVGNPFIALITADNQIRNFNFLQKKNLVNYCLDVRNKNFYEDFQIVLCDKIKNFKQLNKEFKLKSSRYAAKNIINELIRED